MSSKLRNLHRTNFKISSEIGSEQMSKRTIKNPNFITPLSLHYFKIMQQLELQQERTGVKLCWAPFVTLPGQSIRYAIEKAKNDFINKAVDSTPLPTPPAPPEGKIVKIMSYSDKHLVESVVTAPYNPDEIVYEIPVPNDCTCTGILQIKKTGRGANKCHATIDWSRTTSTPLIDGNINVYLNLIIESLEFNEYREVYIQVGAELLKSLPYPDTDENEQYHQAKADYDGEVQAIRLEARKKAEPEAELLANNLLAQIDIRSELLDAVVRQYINHLYTKTDQKLKNGIE